MATKVSEIIKFFEQGKIQKKKRKGRPVAISVDELVNFLRDRGYISKPKIAHYFGTSISAVRNALRRAEDNKIKINWTHKGVALVENGTAEDSLEWAKHIYKMAIGIKKHIKLLAIPTLENVLNKVDLKKLSKKERIYIEEIFSALVAAEAKLQLSEQIDEKVKILENKIEE